MKEIVFSQHAIERFRDRGISKDEVIRTIQEGERIPAKKGRSAFRKNFYFDSKWKDKHYAIKQVVPVVVEEKEKIVVITVYTFYFGGEKK